MLQSIRASRAVIDFLEEFVILFDERVIRLELQRLLVGGAGLIKLAFVLVGNRQVVVRGGVGRINLRRAFPAVNRLAPQAARRDGNTEFDLLLGVAARVGGQRRNAQRQQERKKQRKKAHGRPNIVTGLRDAQALY